MSLPPGLTVDGPLLTLGSDNPLPLDSPRSLWQVENGQVDLFAVAMNPGLPRGRRHFLLRIEAGNLLMRLPGCRAVRDPLLGFIAVGVLDARVQPVRWTDSGTLDAERLAKLVDTWIISVCGVLGPGGGRWPEQVASGTEDLRLSADDRLHGQPGQVCWLESDGTVLGFMGVTAGQSGPVPVTGGTWVTAECDTTLTGTTTKDLVLAGRLGPALDAFHGLLVQLFAAGIHDREIELEQRGMEREQIGRQALGSSLLELAAVIRPGRYERPRETTGGSPIDQVCAEVAGAMGIELSVSRPSGSASRQADQLADALQASQLRHRRVLLPNGWWRRDNGPFIGYRRDGAPVALLPQDANRYRLVDPADGSSSRVDTALAASLRPQADVLYRPFPDQAVSAAGLLRFGLRGVGTDVKRVLALGVGAGLLALALPMGTGVVIDAVLPRAAEDQLWQIVGAMLAAVVGMATFGLVQSLAILRTESRMDWSLQAAVFDRLLKLPAPFFRTYTTGDLSDRVLGIQAIRQMLSSAAVGAFLGVLFSIFSFLLLFVYSVPLAMLSALLGIVAVAVTALLGIGFLRQERKRLKLQGRTEGLVLQLINGADKLRVAAAAPRALAHWGRHYAAQKRHQMLAGRWANGQGIFHGIFPILSSMVLYAAIIWLFNQSVAANGPLQGTSAPLSTGGYLAFNVAFGQFLGAMTTLALTFTEVLGIIPLYERSRPILDGLPERRGESRAPGVLAGQVELSALSFRYAPDLPPVLDGLDLQIRAGELVSIVGASGSGKSTVLRLLLGFEQADRGEVFFDGKALSTLDIQAVRSQIGVVLQNGRIQVGSIFENIVGGADLSLEDAWRAARLAGLEQDIEAMPMGMHTVLTADGRTLSGGQRQRLLIARALVNQPRILLLDEATSALDNRTQAVVTDTLASLNITRVLIAHRLSTIRRVDRIFVIDGGRVAETGSYDELMAAKGVFCELASRQLI